MVQFSQMEMLLLYWSLFEGNGCTKMETAYLLSDKIPFAQDCWNSHFGACLHVIICSCSDGFSKASTMGKPWPFHAFPSCKVLYVLSGFATMTIGNQLGGFCQERTS
jgi:hypothetical protein